MKHVHFFSLVLMLIILAATVSLLLIPSQKGSLSKNPVYFGVAYGGTTVLDAKILIDRIKEYTNLFILDSGINSISINKSAVEEICNYAVNAGLNIIINLGTYTQDNWPWQIQFFNKSREEYGDNFLGVYYDDEVGGIPLDWNWTKQFAEDSPLFWGGNPLDLTEIHYRIQLAEIIGEKPENYTTEAQWFNTLLERNRGHNSLKEYNIPTFTSDYALYWFDYLGGYDTLFVQLGWNQSINNQISLLRGAANMQNKEWGAIVTWKYEQPPYLDSGQNIYDQMVTAYNAGAKYITIFDYPYNSTYNPYGVLAEEHFQALQKFWNQVVSKSTPLFPQAEIALVLPKDYGWGMRTIDDKIWGFWGPDEKSPIIWNSVQTLSHKYGLLLDIIYDDPAFPIQGNYSKIYYWKQVI